MASREGRLSEVSINIEWRERSVVVLFTLVSCLLHTTQREDNAPCYMFSIRSVVVLIDSFEIETQVEFMIRHKWSAVTLWRWRAHEGAFEALCCHHTAAEEHCNKDKTILNLSSPRLSNVAFTSGSIHLCLEVEWHIKVIKTQWVNEFINDYYLEPNEW